MAIISKFFDDLMIYIIREYAGKKRKIFLNVSPLEIMDILLSFFLKYPVFISVQTKA